MKTYTIIWHYVANYGVLQVQADDADTALSAFLQTYHPDMRRKGRILVFASTPAIDARPLDEKSAQYHDYISSEQSM